MVGLLRIDAMFTLSGIELGLGLIDKTRVR